MKNYINPWGIVFMLVFAGVPFLVGLAASTLADICEWYVEKLKSWVD